MSIAIFLLASLPQNAIAATCDTSASDDDFKACVSAALDALETENDTQAAEITALETELAAYEALFDYLSVNTDTDSVIFSGANVYVQSGSGATDGTTNGLGNLIVGYDETHEGDEGLKTGSHNLILGFHHMYNSYGGLITGRENALWDEHAVVLGGRRNSADADYAVVVGGFANTANANYAAVVGGQHNTTNTDYATVVGGQYNTTDISAVADLSTYLSVNTDTDSVIFSGANVYVQSGSGATNGDPDDPTADSDGTSVNGLGNLIIGYDENDGDTKSGSHNLVVGDYHSYSSYGGIIGGHDNEISGVYASVLGGRYNTASGKMSTVSGGYDNLSGSRYTTIGGGQGNTASNYVATVSGGEDNTASGLRSVVSGGRYNTASGNHSAVAGGYEITASRTYATDESGGGDRGHDHDHDGWY